MDGFDPEQDAGLTAVVELLERERPALTIDELGRVDDRLNTFRAPRRARRAPRPRSRLAVVICLTLGLLFMTAGTGLAISGFATPGTASHAQYPDRSTTGGSPPPAGPGHRAPSRHSRSSSLGEIRSAGPTSTIAVSLTQAQAHSELPFTGFNAIPILVAGIALIVTGAAVNRRTRGS